MRLSINEDTTKIYVNIDITLEKYISSDTNYSCHGIDEISSYLSVQAFYITLAALSQLTLSSLLME